MNKANISTGVFLYTAVFFIFLSGAHIDAAELTDEEVVQIILLIGGDGPPVVSAGNDAGAVAGTSVEIRADISGSANNSMWEQLTGPVVDISGSLFSVLRFDAPAVAVETELSFRLTADDGSGGTLQDDISVTIHPNAVPELSVAFPCDGCRAYGSHLSIRGWATPGADVDFVSAQESVAVQVNVGGEDLPAVVSDSGEWVLQDAPLPSGIGEVQITVTAEDAFGQSTIQELTLTLAPTLSGPRLAAHPLDDGKLVFLDQGFYERLSVYDVATELFTVVYENLGANVLSQVLDIEVDPDGSRVLFGESPTGRILEIDLTSGGLSTVSNVNVGTGPALQSIREIALNADDRELIVFDRTQQALFAVDLDSGDRVEIAAVTNTPFLAVDTTGDSAFVATEFEGFPIEYSNLLEVDLNTGEVSDRGSIDLWAPSAVDYDPENDQLGLLAAFSNRVYTVNRDTATVSILSEQDSGDTVISYPSEILTDQINNRFLINGFSSSFSTPDTNTVVGVDPTTAESELIFRDSVGTGPTLHGNTLLRVSSNDGVLLAVNQGSGYLYSVSLAEGNRTLISGGLIGVGPSLQTPFDIALLGENHVLVVDAGLQALVRINRTTGDRAVVSSSSVGSGIHFDAPRALSISSQGNMAYVADDGLGVVFSVDLASGDRTILSGVDQNDVSLIEVTALDLDESQNRLVISDMANGGTRTIKVIGVDLDTGDRSIIYSWTTGTGPFLNTLYDIEVISEDQIAVIAAGDDLLSLDLTTGNRSVLANNSTGHGDVIEQILSVARDADADVVYGWSNLLQGIVALDLDSADRVVLSK